MKMDKFCAGLVALVAGLALSAGNASATAGYTSGDPAMMKLVPYYETGPMKATIIGVQNLSMQEASTMTLNDEVTAMQAALDEAMMGDSEDAISAAQMALDEAMMAAQVEHLFVSVNVYTAMGMMMGSAELCLAEHQFGYVILQGPGMQASQEATGLRGKILSVDNGDISAYGYVEITAMDKWSACAPTAGARGEAGWSEIASGNGRVAAWTIIQDVGMGFFGTEVPTTTLSKSSVPGVPETGEDTGDAIAAGDSMLACYSGGETVPGRDADDATMADDTGVASNMTGDFMMMRCGLIPERHDNSRNADGAPDTTTTVAEADRATTTAATPRAHAFARYDAGDESMIYVWLAEDQDTDDTHASMTRMLDVVVKCEDGMVIDMMPDVYGDMVPLQTGAPNMLTMIDPTMGAVGDATAMCAGNRGVLRITMPDMSTAGMVFSHITQMGGHYRMNFPGYSMANPMTCWEMGPAGVGDADGNGSIGDDETGIDADGDGDATGDAEDLAAARANACMAR